MDYNGRVTTNSPTAESHVTARKAPRLAMAELALARFACRFVLSEVNRVVTHD